MIIEIVSIMSYVTELFGVMVALSVLFLWWAFPLTMAMLLPYYFISRNRFGHWLNPFVKSDVLVPMASTSVWTLLDLHGLSAKSMANLVELPTLGLVWTALFLLRLTLLCSYGRKNSALCICLNGLVVLIAGLCALLLPDNARVLSVNSRRLIVPFRAPLH